MIKLSQSVSHLIGLLQAVAAVAATWRAAEPSSSRLSVAATSASWIVFPVARIPRTIFLDSKTRERYPCSRFLPLFLERPSSETEIIITASSDETPGQYEDRVLRFGGVGRLYSNSVAQSTKSAHGAPTPELLVDPHLTVLDRLQQAVVAVVGLGGVGSWAAEALCRSGVGNLILIDLDDICVSNCNRQLHAMSSTVGQMKIDAMQRRLKDIQPSCNITLLHDFISVESASEIVSRLQKELHLTVVLDAIDGSDEKTALLAACADYRIPVVTCGAAAGKVDPTQVVCQDLTEVEGDRLLSNCRKNLRKFRRFQRGLSFRERQQKGPDKKRIRKWNIPAVHSLEEPRKAPALDDSSSFRRCDGALGTACMVTGTYGFVAASRIVSMIANDNFKPPRR